MFGSVGPPRSGRRGTRPSPEARVQDRRPWCGSRPPGCGRVPALVAGLGSRCSARQPSPLPPAESESGRRLSDGSGSCAAPVPPDWGGKGRPTQGPCRLQAGLCLGRRHRIRAVHAAFSYSIPAYTSLRGSRHGVSPPAGKATTKPSKAQDFLPGGPIPAGLEGLVRHVRLWAGILTPQPVRRLSQDRQVASGRALAEPGARPLGSHVPHPVQGMLDAPDGGSACAAGGQLEPERQVQGAQWPSRGVRGLLPRAGSARSGQSPVGGVVTTGDTMVSRGRTREGEAS